MTIRPNRYERYRKEGRNGSYAKTYRRAERTSGSGASTIAKPSIVDVVTADFTADRRRDPG